MKTLVLSMMANGQMFRRKSKLFVNPELLINRDIAINELENPTRTVVQGYVQYELENPTRTIGVVNKVCLTLTLNVSSQWHDLIG
jgi:hypothetical protein